MCDSALRRHATPDGVRNLLAFTKALLRRGTEKDSLLTRTFGQFRIDSRSRTVIIANKIVAMSGNEFDVLWLLASQAGRVAVMFPMIATVDEFRAARDMVDVECAWARRRGRERPGGWNGSACRMRRAAWTTIRSR